MISQIWFEHRPSVCLGRDLAQCTMASPVLTYFDISPNVVCHPGSFCTLFYTALVSDILILFLHPK